MKTIRNITAILIILSFLATSSKGQNFTNQNKEAILKSVNEKLDQLVNLLNQKDVDGVFSLTGESELPLMTSGGRSIQTKDSAIAVFKTIYSRIENQKITVLSKKIEVLDPNIVKAVLQFKEDFINKDKSSHLINGCWTIIFRKTDGDWRFLHTHQSFSN